MDNSNETTLLNGARQELYDLQDLHLAKLGCCLWSKKTEDGRHDKTASPFLYAKMKMNNKTGKVYTNFHKARPKKGEDTHLKLQDIE